MNFARKALLVIITPLFVLLLYTLAIGFGAWHVVGNPTNVKKLINDSGVYNSAVNDVLAQSGPAIKGDLTLTLNAPIVRSAASQSIPPTYIRSNTEAVIDSIYRWLNGQTNQPDFRVDLTSAKKKFANTLSQQLAKKIASLPICTPSEIPSAYDPVTATCLPSIISSATAGSIANATILNGKGFLDKPVITADSITSTSKQCDQTGLVVCPKSQQTSIFQNQLKNVPKQYQRVKEAPIVLTILTILMALGVVFLNASRPSGLRHAGILLLLTGLFILLFAWSLNYAVSQKVAPKLAITNAVVNKDAKTILVDLVQMVDKTYWLFGGAYTALGVLAIGGSIYYGRNKPKTLEAATPTKAAPSSPAKAPTDKPAVKPAEPTKPANKPKRIIKVQ